MGFGAQGEGMLLQVSVFFLYRIYFFGFVSEFEKNQDSAES